MPDEENKIPIGEKFEAMVSEDVVVDGGEEMGESPPKDDDVISFEKYDKERNHETLSRELYSKADKESYYNSYEYLHKVTRTDKFGPIVKILAGNPGKIVDMGCGTGLWTKILSDIDHVTGTDFSEARIEIAKERNPGMEYIVGDLKEMSSMFQEGSIGMFFSCCSLYCLTKESQTKIFADCLKILMPGGKLIMIEPNKDNFFKEKSEIKYPFDKKETSKLLEKIGFRNVKIRNYNFIPRNFIRNRGILYKILIPVEKIMEAIQMPFSGSLLIYAEKPASQFPEPAYETSS